MTRPFTQGIYLKYSALERVASVEDIRHPILREALALQELRTPQIEITSLADIPGRDRTGFLRKLHHRAIESPVRPSPQVDSSARVGGACLSSEIDRLREPIGKQDQYIAAYGGLTCFTFHKDERVTVEPLHVSMDTMFDLEDNLLLFFTGFSRSAPESAGPTGALPGIRRRDAAQPPLRQGAGAAQPGGPWRAAISCASASSCTSTGSTRSAAPAG